MKRYVVDASTTLKWIFDDEEDVVAARKLLSDYLLGQVLLFVPSLWLVEVANAIKAAVLSGRVSRKKGESLLELILNAKPKIISFDSYVKTAFVNACKYKISVYDSVYLTIALENETPFITADKKLFSALKKLGKKIILLNLY